jgi:HlyD family secretion protein
MKLSIRTALPVAVLAMVAVLGAYHLWDRTQHRGPGPGFVSGNGRIEATEVDVAAKVAGRLEAVLVREGDFVEAGQPLARMQVQSLLAQRDEAVAREQQAQQGVSAAQAQVALRESEVQAVQAQVVQRESELEVAQRYLARMETLAKGGSVSGQMLDDARARALSLQAALAAVRAQVGAARAAVTAAGAQVTSAQAAVRAAKASTARIAVELADSELKAPRAGRVQFLVAQPGEMIAGGGKVLNLVDVSDVYMTFFLPETVAGRVALGAEVRIVLDAAPDFVIPARVSFVASTAQFTPKTVETASERQKLMFRVKAQIPRELLLAHREQVKTGLPGLAWLRLDANAEWPAGLQIRAGQ